MTPDDFVALLREHWPSTVAALDPDAREELAAVLRGLAGATDVQTVQTALRRLRRVLRALPDVHPVAAALRGAVRFTGTPDPQVVDRAPVLALLATLQASPGGDVGTAPDPASDPDPSPAPIPDPAQAAPGPDPDPVRARLLAVPSLAAADVAAAPGDPGLIRLRHPELGYRYPRFQFSADGRDTTRPLPVVGLINRLLMADRDPWGAADWWLGGNRWLRGVPAELLGSVPDEELARAARELVEGD
ncbi:hypothetical protein [Streptomyces sp. NPDC003943]